ncbi:nuclear transport factor 2 family protein [Saccharomonospora iraqiensis]|uniref:nuclear transport factor 2 family protein n=1 Tax=Saccharomonospora iraqiensis TaxID=52698 RepID=UPI0003F6A811|nr:nuclear transport factor 2 family protein [Saccharomonospora iraqiensis]
MTGTDRDTLTTADRFALADLPARYARYVDDRRWQAALELFTDDAEFVLPDPPRTLAPTLVHRGHAGIADVLTALEAVPVTFHALVGEVVDAGPEPGTATGTVACEAHHLLDPGPGDTTDLVWHLRYTDVYRRVGDTWLFTRRALRLAWAETRAVRHS